MRRRTSRSKVIGLISWLVCLCMLAATLPALSYALAPKSIFEKGSSPGMTADEDELSGGEFTGAGGGRRYASGGPEGMRKWIAKTLREITGGEESGYDNELRERPKTEMRRIYEYLKEFSGDDARRLAVPVSPSKAVDFLFQLAACQRSEIYRQDIYEDAAACFFSAARSRDLTGVGMADLFLEEACCGGHEDEPVQRAQILQAVSRLNPDLFRKIFYGSLVSKHWDEYVLVYQCMPDRALIKEWCLENPSVLPSEMWRLLFGNNVPAPSSWDALVYKSYVECVKQHDKIPDIGTLTRKVRAAAKREKLAFKKPYPVVQVKQSVERLNRLYRFDVLLANRAIGFWPQRLREVREKMGMPQHELARKARLGMQAITEYEKGRVAPRTKDLLRIAKGLGADPLYFMGNERIKVRCAYPIDSTYHYV